MPTKTHNVIDALCQCTTALIHPQPGRRCAAAAFQKHRKGSHTLALQPKQGCVIRPQLQS
jgi:hypothetical protein